VVQHRRNQNDQRDERFDLDGNNGSGTKAAAARTKAAAFSTVSILAKNSEISASLKGSISGFSGVRLANRSLNANNILSSHIGKCSPQMSQRNLAAAHRHEQLKMPAPQPQDERSDDKSSDEK
jgi:hypothetical protein